MSDRLHCDLPDPHFYVTMMTNSPLNFNICQNKLIETVITIYGLLKAAQMPSFINLKHESNPKVYLLCQTKNHKIEKNLTISLAIEKH